MLSNIEFITELHGNTLEISAIVSYSERGHAHDEILSIAASDGDGLDVDLSEKESDAIGLTVLERMERVTNAELEAIFS